MTTQGNSIVLPTWRITQFRHMLEAWHGPPVLYCSRGVCTFPRILSSTLTGKLYQRVQQNTLESTHISIKSGYDLLTSYSQELNKNFLAFPIFFSKGSDLQLPWNMLCESVRGARPLSALLPLNHHFSPPWHWPSLRQKQSLYFLENHRTNCNC